MAGPGAGGRGRQHAAPRPRRGLAPDAPGAGGGAALLDRHGGPLDEVGLARLGRRLEAAPRHHRRRRLDPPGGGTDARECGRQ